MKNILVLGGAGFVGQHVCQRAINLGHTVFALSRNGKPNNDLWTEKVELIPKVDAIVHTIGILLDSKIPLVGSIVNEISKNNQSYEEVNKETAIVPAQELINHALENEEGPKKTFVFISAERGLPFAPKYLSTKREVEDFLNTNQMQGFINTVILRPGFIYGESKQPTKILAQAFKLMNMQDILWQKVGLQNIAEQIVPAPPVDVEKVANAAIKACTDESLQGKTLNSKEIDSLPL